MADGFFWCEVRGDVGYAGFRVGWESDLLGR